MKIASHVAGVLVPYHGSGAVHEEAEVEPLLHSLSLHAQLLQGGAECR